MGPDDELDELRLTRDSELHRTNRVVLFDEEFISVPPRTTSWTRVADEPPPPRAGRRFWIGAAWGAAITNAIWVAIVSLT